MSSSSSAVRKRQTDARYDLRSATEPPNGLARLPSRNLNARTAIGAVTDPTDTTGRARSIVRVNRTTDILELEHSHKRISVGAYQCGRLIMRVFERSHGLQASAPTYEPKSRVNAINGHENVIIRGLETAQECQAWLRRIEQAVGTVGARLLRQVLDDGRTYAELSALRGRGTSERAVASIAGQFRQLLEDLADDLAAKGRHR